MVNDEPDRALGLLERAVGDGRGDPEWMQKDNDLARLRDHPRFRALIERMG